jgi:hypothetical protein
MATRPQLFSGVRGQFVFTQPGGAKVTFAFATDISVSVRHSVRPSYVLGDMNAIAIDSLSYDVDVSIGRLVPINNSNPSEAALGRDPAVAGSIQPGAGYGAAETLTTALKAGLEISIATILTTNSVDLDIVDRTTGKTVASIKECRFAGRSSSLNAQDVLTERLNFVGIYDAGYEGTANSATIGYGV